MRISAKAAAKLLNENKRNIPVPKKIKPITNREFVINTLYDIEQREYIYEDLVKECSLIETYDFKKKKKKNK